MCLHACLLARLFVRARVCWPAGGRLLARACARVLARSLVVMRDLRLAWAATRSTFLLPRRAGARVRVCLLVMKDVKDLLFACGYRSFAGPCGRAFARSCGRACARSS